MKSLWKPKPLEVARQLSDAESDVLTFSTSIVRWPSNKHDESYTSSKSKTHHQKSKIIKNQKLKLLTPLLKRILKHPANSASKLTISAKKISKRRSCTCRPSTDNSMLEFKRCSKKKKLKTVSLGSNSKPFRGKLQLVWLKLNKLGRWLPSRFMKQRPTFHHLNDRYLWESWSQWAKSQILMIIWLHKLLWLILNLPQTMWSLGNNQMLHFFQTMNLNNAKEEDREMNCCILSQVLLKVNLNDWNQK